MAKHSVFRIVLVTGIVIFASHAALGRRAANEQPQVKDKMLILSVWPDRDQYSMMDSVIVNVALRNTGDKPVFIDRRMFWGGISAGLAMEVRDDHGRLISGPARGDTVMPPPQPGDRFLLVELDPGFLYGTRLRFVASERFPHPGKYTIRFVYKSWLVREFVPPEYRNLAALWDDYPEITSAPEKIESSR